MEMFNKGKFKARNSTERIKVINPATEEIISDSSHGTLLDMQDALGTARVAIESWKETPSNEQTVALHRIATNNHLYHKDLVELGSMEEGKPIPENEVELGWVVNQYMEKNDRL